MTKAKTETKTVEIRPIDVKSVKITIAGTSDLILNKMNDPTVKQLTDIRKDKAKDLEKPNFWECIITSMHWRDGKPTDFSEEGLKEALVKNAPCIPAFAFMKSFGDAVVRNGIDTYATKLKASMNIPAKAGLIPIKFTEHYIDEKLMQPKKGAPVLTHLNRFSGWSAELDINYVENVYSINQIIAIINLAGFGGGIGSGRSSGYGRYSIINVE